MDASGNDFEQTERRKRPDQRERPSRDGPAGGDADDSRNARAGIDEAANGEPDEDGDAEGSGTDGSAGSSRSRGRLWRIAMALRNGAFVLLPVGFIGLTVTDAWLTLDESPYSLLFAGGIVCAIASIYLAIYQHDIDE